MDILYNWDLWRAGGKRGRDQYLEVPAKNSEAK